MSTIRTTEQRADSTHVGRLPDFFIIGAMKAGTTTLYEYLCRHPDIFGCANKEPGFFSREQVFARGIDWYRKLFEEAKPHQRCFEASTCYSRWPHFGDVAQRIAQAVPHACFIYIMRHPVDRAYSHYGHLMRLKVTMTFEQALEIYPEIIDASLYLQQIQRFLEYFDRGRFLFLTLDDMQRTPDAVLEQVQMFLGLAVRDLTSGGPLRANRAGTSTATVRISDQLRRVRHWPGVAQIATAVPASWRANLHRRLTQTLSNSVVGRTLADRHKSRFSPMLPETRRKLMERFAGPTRELERFLGRSLAEWMH